MAGNARFYKNVHFMEAKYKSKCPECPNAINKGDMIVYLSSFQVSIHFNCFYKGPVISYPDKNLSPGQDIVIDPKFALKTQFMILLYRLRQRQPKQEKAA